METRNDYIAIIAPLVSLKAFEYQGDGGSIWAGKDTGCPVLRLDASNAACLAVLHIKKYPNR